MEPHSKLAPTPKPTHDPTKVSRSLAIALVFSALFLLAAAGIALWLLVFKGSGQVANTLQDPDANTKNVKNVSFAAPATLPPEFTKNDQSPLGAIRIYYFNNATNCGFTTQAMPLAADKNAKDTAVASVESAQAPGVALTSNVQATQVELKDSNDGKPYKFDSLDIEQSVNVPGVSFTKQNSVVLYKQFGQKVASLTYSCRAEEWAARKEGMAALASTFTVTTER